MGPHIKCGARELPLGTPPQPLFTPEDGAPPGLLNRPQRPLCFLGSKCKGGSEIERHCIRPSPDRHGGSFLLPWLRERGDGEWDKGRDTEGNKSLKGNGITVRKTGSETKG